jgi:fatty acid desaturase
MKIGSKSYNEFYATLYLLSVSIVIISCFTLLYFFNSFLLSIAVILIISARQHALLIIEHECWHNNMYKNKILNDLAGSLFAGWLVGSPFFSGRSKHLKHHRHLGTPDDPDLKLHELPSGSSKRFILLHFVKLLLGGQVLYTLFNKNEKEVLKRPKVSSLVVVEFIGILICQVFILFSFWYFLGWWAYIIYWALPIFTTTTLFNGIRAFVEHNIEHDERSSKKLFSMKSSFIERFFLAPMNFNYHAEHHIRPGVSAFDLPKLREHYLQKERLKLRKGYMHYLFSLIN